MDRKKVVVVEQDLVNEYGSGYGRRYLLFAQHPQDADRWIRENLDGPDGDPYYHNQDMWNQIRVEVVSYFDAEGNASREPWWDLLEAFAKKEIGPSVLKQVARLSQWWPPESKE